MDHVDERCDAFERAMMLRVDEKKLSAKANLFDMAEVRTRMNGKQYMNLYMFHIHIALTRVCTSSWLTI